MHPKKFVETGYLVGSTYDFKGETVINQDVAWLEIAMDYVQRVHKF